MLKLKFPKNYLSEQVVADYTSIPQGSSVRSANIRAPTKSLFSAIAEYLRTSVFSSSMMDWYCDT